MCSPPYPCNPDFTRTLPNPKRHSVRNGLPEVAGRAKDDHMLIPNGMYVQSPSPASSLVIKGSYISSPSPAPPPDGSYFNMSDKYISYPPVVSGQKKPPPHPFCNLLIILIVILVCVFRLIERMSVSVLIGDPQSGWKDTESGGNKTIDSPEL